MSSLFSSPTLERHCNTMVVRDDLLPGGTKARIFRALVAASPASEFVYAGPAFGAAQIALAAVCYQQCRQAVLFVPWRAARTRYTIEAARYGARIFEVKPGYLSVLRSRARRYCDEHEAELVPFGGGMQIGPIVSAAQSLSVEPSEVWCAAGSGTLAQALRAAWPAAQLNLVQVGRSLPPIAGATVHKTNQAFADGIAGTAPFPTHPNYEAKAWRLMQKIGASPGSLFWNVHG
ncbi:hypothetical protein [Stappia sp.]|uniref:hypothetical protein n=1 Tax=Stappia sp. TaxID=1870903 RepID=UPI003C79D34D